MEGSTRDAKAEVERELCAHHAPWLCEEKATRGVWCGLERWRDDDDEEEACYGCGCGAGKEADGLGKKLLRARLECLVWCLLAAPIACFAADRLMG